MTRTIADNLADVRDRIARAAAAAGRSAADVTLIAVSKTHPVDAVQQAIAAGQTVFGENRVQEGAAKFTGLADRHRLDVHLIGPLQTNKARDAVAHFDVIQTLDRDRLAAALALANPQTVRRMLVQVNTGDEPQKAGVPRANAQTFLRALPQRHGLQASGVMCIPPVGEDPTPHFAWLAELADRHGLPIVSMGMSADYELAVRMGATHVRIGSAIFGTRG